jgi:endonuclease/exonuclease/phosphatase family metal-dependent hydrolase
VTGQARELRVLSYNVHGLRDDRRALAEVVRGTDPDLVCVQEAPKYLRWRAKCAALAREWGLMYVAGGGSAGGSALFAHLRVDVDDARSTVLSRQYGWPDRGIASALITKGGAQLAVASIHLPLTAETRSAHGSRVREVLSSYATAHQLAAGDLNEQPLAAAWQAFHAGGLGDLDPDCGPTFPAAAPRKRIDGILATDGVRVLEHHVVDGKAVARASDHRPLLAVLSVPVGASAGQASSPGRSPAR